MNPLVSSLLSLILVASPSIASAQSPDAPKKKKKMPAVIAYEVAPKALTNELELLGTLKSSQSVNITANVSETIAKIHFKDGESVKKGQLLVSLNSKEEQALLEEATETVREAKSQYLRQKDLKKQGYSSQSVIDETYKNWKKAQAQQKVIEARLADRKVHAPFSGQLGFIQLNEGAMVSTGKTITTLDNTYKMNLDLRVPTRYSSAIQLGDMVSVRLNRSGNQRFKGKVSAISARVDDNLKMLQVRALIDNPKQQLKSNQLVKAFLSLQKPEELVIPNTAILMLGDKKFVYLLEAEKKDIYQLKKVEIETGQRYPKMSQVLSGLEEKDLIVSHGLIKLSPNKKVKIQTIQTDQPLETLIRKSKGQK